MATEHSEQDESYFVSMTDLMVGMLFIFIILLMAFALNLKAQETRLTQTDKAREQMLRDIETALRNKGIPVTVLPESGVLRLPEQVLFDVNSSELQPKGLDAVAKLGEALDEILPCYAGATPRPSCEGNKYDGRLESVFIEGHTDDTGTSDRNWQLSYQRARAVYVRLHETWPQVGEIRNDKDGEKGKGEKLIGVSGYADQRPAVMCPKPAQGPTRAEIDAAENCRRLNRRIDLRFIMAVPDPERKEKLESALNPEPATP